MKKINHQTTDKQYKEFMKECDYWIEFFGMHDWDVIYKYDKETKSDCYACAYPDYSSRLVVLCLNKNWGEIKPTLTRVRRYAFHEVDEIRYYKLSKYPIDRIITVINMKQKDIGKFVVNLKKEMDEIKHMLIGADENRIWKPMYEKRFKCKIKLED